MTTPPKTGLIRRSQLAALGINYSPTTIRKMVREKRFPPWHAEGSSTRLHVWPAETIHLWLSGQWKPNADSMGTQKEQA